jgi:hypothetical protein
MTKWLNTSLDEHIEQVVYSGVNAEGQRAVFEIDAEKITYGSHCHLKF